MCRLTLVLPKNEKVDRKLATTVMSVIASSNSTDKGQQDGCGFAILGKENAQAFVSKEAAYTFLASEAWFNEYEKEWVPRLKDSSVFMAHVRQASYGISVDEKNSHPFVIDGRFICEHNGTIRNKEVFDKEVESDSEAFFKYLAKQAGDTPLTYEILKDALEKIEGCFCMFINDRYDPDPESVWVVVGKDRELHLSENDNMLLINTTSSGIECIKYFNQELRMLGNKNYKNLNFPTPVKLDAETIFKLSSDGTLSKAGPVKENNIYPSSNARGAVRHTSHVPFWEDDDKYAGNYNGKSKSAEFREEVKLWHKVYTELALNFEDLSKLFILLGYVTKGGNPQSWVSLSDIELCDLENLVEYLGDPSKNLFRKNLLYGRSLKKKTWEKILEKLNRDSLKNDPYEIIYHLTGVPLDFPYWMNTPEQLEAALDYIEDIELDAKYATV